LKLQYTGSNFFRIVQNYGIFGGDIIRNDGTSGESIYGMVFRDENYTIMHD
jgi:cyclophilin family peptidyl-prolyl cis-trans isomerase